MANSALGQTGPQLKISTVTGTGDGSTTTFALGVSPGAKTALDVFLDGVKQFQTEWELSGSNIVFDTAPASDVAIEIIVGAGHGVGTVSDGTITEPKLAAGATLKLGTEQASTSGTAIDFTGIPSGTKQIVVMLEGVSTNGVDYLVMQLGDSGGIESTGYAGGGGLLYDTGNAAATALTSGHINYGAFAAGRTVNVVATLTLKDSANNTWAMTANVFAGDTTDSMQSALYLKSLSAVLDRVRIAGASGDTFDAGSINIAYK